MTYATQTLHEEVVYLALHFHWSLDDLLDLEHADRRQFVAQVARLTAAPPAGGPVWTTTETVWTAGDTSWD